MDDNPGIFSAKTGRSQLQMAAKFILSRKMLKAGRKIHDGQRNELNTDELVIHTKRRLRRNRTMLLLSRAAVTTIKAIGLEANLNKETLRLKQRVRGVHEF